jgi:hypothetical protein
MKRAFIDQIGILLYIDEAGNKYPTAVLHEKNPPRVKFPPVDGKTENAVYEDSNGANQFKPNSHTTFADHLDNLTYQDLTSPTSKHTVKQVLPKLTNLYVKH